MNATQDGDTVRVMAGTYVNDFATVRHKISMESVGGLAVMQATVAPPNGKALLVVDDDLTITGFGFTGAAVADHNGAGIRYDTGNLVVRNSVFWGNQDGLLANGVPTGSIVIDGCEFSQNGSGDGYTHNLYVGAIGSLLVQNSYFHDAVGGHEVKSRALSTTIINNRIFQNAGNGSYAIDIPDGGTALVQGNVIEKGPNAPNYITIHYGGENGPYAGSSLRVTGNTIVNDNPNGYLLANNATGVTATLSNNQVWGYATDHLTIGSVTQSNETTLTARPTLDLTSIAPTLTVPTPTDPTTPTVPTTIHVPDGVAYTTYGIAGAVTATGHILTVGGATGQFRTLAAALAVSADGDTINVAAGTYTNDFGTVNHKVIIQGVGGIARFVQQNVPGAPGGILVVNTDATLKNLAFEGATNYSGREGGVAVYGGNVTVVNSSMSYNDIGIVTADNPAITLSVYGSDLFWNGNGARGTHNMFVGAIGSLTIKDSILHGATTGHELFDHAYNTNIQNNRIFDGTAATSFSLDLGYGGNAVIANNVIEKGVNAANGIFVQVGGDGSLYDNTNVAITGNTFIEDMVNEGHPYTYFISAVDGIQSVGPVTATNNTFVGGVPGSRQAINVTPTGSVVATSATLDTSSPVSAALAPAVAPAAPTGPSTLTLSLSELRDYQDAQFAVLVDNVVVGGGVVTANHGMDPSQTFRFNGNWGSGPHTVKVVATNLLSGYDIYARKLFIDGANLDGGAVLPRTELNYYNTTFTTTLQATSVPDFDRVYYLAHNPDVAAAGVDPLAHYLAYGWTEGRDPNAWFSTSFYLGQNPDVAASGVNPLVHYATVGWMQGRDPSAIFSTNAYLAANPDVVAAHYDPLWQYMAAGQYEGRAIYPAVVARVTSSDPLVSLPYYYTQHPSVATARIDPARDYHATGAGRGWDPNPWFSTSFYLANNPDVAAAKVDPLEHFDSYGWKEGRLASPYFSSNLYLASHPEVAAAGIDPMLAFMQSSESSVLPSQSPYRTAEARMFDATYYLTRNPDVAAAHVDPLVHYDIYGWREGRNPSATFDTDKYLQANGDVKAAGVDPLRHYADYGVLEGRPTFPVS